jgi:hypothetical protein
MNLLQFSEPQVKPTNGMENTENSESESNLMPLVSWLFLIGSLIFQVDAILELTEGISLHVVLHLSASLLFTIGSILFVVYDGQQR